ncbi:MAG: DNA primase [Candidatus Cryptobacteroides sp.]
MIPQETVNRILDAAQITDVVGDFVSLKRRGANYVACCPFHNEKTPSFYVSPAKGIYKCFGCGKSGTAIGFVMEHESLTYVEALKFLARKYGIEVVEKEETAEEIAAKQRSESLYLVSEFAESFFQENLDKGEGHIIGYQYFKQRGLEDATIKKYGLGWAPKSRNAFFDAAKSKGYKEEFLIATGLCIKNEDGSIVDRFYDRVMFPIHTISGRVVAFGGRTLKSGHPAMKYVNSPETEIYVKSNSLYGLYFAKNEISRQDKCYLVEGYLDVLSMHQLGITNVVASSGTSLTVPQIRLIKKFTDNITIMYDGDSAGIRAALRGIGLILKEGMNVKVVLIPDGEDPDSYAKSHTLQEVRNFIESGERDFIGFKIDLLLEEAGNDPLKRAELINDIADTIALIPDAVKRTVYVQSSGERLKINQDVLFRRVAATRTKVLEEDLKAVNRENARIENIASHEETINRQPYYDDKSSSISYNIENELLAPSERELLWFILNNGLDYMEFETDSNFYDAENTVTVADFIDSAISADNHQFENSIFRKVYQAYYNLYYADASIVQQDIVRSLMDGQDREIASLVSELTQEKYMLTVKNFKDSMTAVSTQLVKNIPRTILVYQSRRIQSELKELQEKLERADVEEQVNIIKEIQVKTKLRKVIDEKLGRVR